MTDETSAAGEMIDAAGEDLEILVAGDATLKARVRVHGRRNTLVVGAGSVVGRATSATDPDDPAALIIDGEDNQVILGEDVTLNLRLIVRGNGHRVEIGSRCVLQGRANLLGDGAILVIGEGTTMVDGSLQLHEAGEIRIGEDCMISSQVYVSLSDMHPIYDRSSGARINPAASISIGDHVWVGLRGMVLKGARIGDGAVVAAGALVSGAVPSHAIVAGVPAKLVRENIAWRRDFTEGAPDPQGAIGPRKRAKRWGPF